jgi:hypothetical protein
VAANRISTHAQVGGNASDGKALFMSQDGDSAIPRTATLLVNATKQPPDRMRIAVRGGTKLICPEPIDPTRYLRCSLQPAISVQAQADAVRPSTRLCIELVDSCQSRDGQAVDLLSITRGSHLNVDERNLDAAAVSIDAAIAASVAIILYQQSENGDDASSLTLRAGVIFLDHCID